MILEKLNLIELKNVERFESGMDSYTLSHNKQHFSSYPHKVVYQYNSRGYRDQEWPNESLDKVIWCVGDSFTLGLGSPLEHTWPEILQKEIGIPTITIAMDGASNQWIHRQASYIVNEIHPKNMVVMWSYFHRRELDNPLETDLKRRIWNYQNTNYDDDYIMSKVLINSLHKKRQNTNIIHFTVPQAYPDFKKDVYKIENVDNFLGEVNVLDKARDSFHFDILTSESVVKKIIPYLSI